MPMRSLIIVFLVIRYSAFSMRLGVVNTSKVGVFAFHESRIRLMTDLQGKRTQLER